MKTRLLVGLLMIFLINGQTSADDDFESAMELIKKIVGWGMQIYGKIDAYKNPDRTGERIMTIMKQVEEVSNKLDALETHLDIKLDAMLNTLLADIKLEGNLNQLQGKLRHCFTKIDSYFDQSREYKINGSFGNDTLRSFAHKALWSTGSVPDFLDEMLAVFIPGGAMGPGFLSVMLEHSLLNRLRSCDTFVSMHQKAYYIYVHVIIAEVKGLLAQQHCLNIKHVYDETSHSYNAELNTARRKFGTRLRQYHSVFTQVIGQIPHHLRRCEANPPQRGQNFIELDKLSRIAILDREIVENERCFACPAESTLNDVSTRTNTKVYNCKEMTTVIVACPAASGSSREFMWWEDESGNHYGGSESCSQTQRLSGGYVRIPGNRGFDIFHQCKVCACSTDMNQFRKDDSRVWRISVTDQLSDIWNNKIVTGVRFITQDNVLHLQIQQARVVHTGMNHNGSEWKPLNLGLYNAGFVHVDRPMNYEPLRHDRKSIYLDDISVPENYVVTGVRFHLAGDSAFKLQIHASEYDFEKGDVSLFGGSWIDADEHPMRPDDYKRDRIEIDMGSSHNPTKASELKYTLESNKLIKFTHTDMNKDGGQTTIPLLDSQSVETQPPFPLSGVGLSFIGRDGYSGYIAPRVYTFITTKHIKVPEETPNNSISTVVRL